MYIKYNSYNNKLSIVDNDSLNSSDYFCENIEGFVTYVSDRVSASYMIKNGLESFKAELLDKSFRKYILNPSVGVHPSVIDKLNDLIDEKL